MVILDNDSVRYTQVLKHHKEMLDVIEHGCIMKHDHIRQ